MFFKLFSQSTTSNKEEKSTQFSRFIRTASSRDKKKVFKRVLEKATQDQLRVLDLQHK